MKGVAWLMVFTRLIYCLFALLVPLMEPTAIAQSALQTFGLAPAKADGKAHVVADAPARAALVADVQSVVPGKPFRLGVQYSIREHWHLYWRNSGDSGFATTITLTLPPGFTAVGPEWPAPRRFVTQSETTYGYADEVVLFYTITPPATLPPGPLEFKAESHWLACREECIPGDANLTLTLPVGDGAAAVTAQQIERFAGQVPKSGEAPATLASQLPAIVQPGAATELQFALPLSASDVAALRESPAVYGLFNVFPDDLESTHTRMQVAGESLKLTLTIQARPQAQPGRLEIDSVLVLPDTTGASPGTKRIAFKIPVEIQGNRKAAAPAAAATNGNNSTKPLGFVATAEVQKPLWINLLFALLGGLLLNVMPCVLPVISLKILGFVRQANESPGRVRLLGLTYAGGILVSFMALALFFIAIKTGGAQVGWGFHFQEPRFVIIMAAIVLALALSLLGVFTLEPPRVAGQLAAAAPREGVGAAFWNGVLTTTLATPCTAPFLGPALGVAFTKSAPVVALFFMMVGLGLGLPYIVLAFRPGWLKWLPRPGAWMEVFKQLMGFVLLGTVIWLLWSLTSLTSAQVLMWVLTYLLLVAVASWWLGLALDPARRRPARRVGVVGALALCLIGYFALPERALRASDRLIASGDTPTAAVANVTTGGITWEPFAVERIEAETRAGRTVFVDFTAEWCTTCKLNEHGVLATDAVAELFNRHKVLALRADWTRRNELIARILAQFGRSGVPLYVVFPAGRPEAPIVLPTLLRTSDIEKAFADAAQATTVARAP